MKIELINVCTFLVGFVAPINLFSDVSGISQVVSYTVISIVCGYGSMSMMKEITKEKDANVATGEGERK